MKNRSLRSGSAILPSKRRKRVSVRASLPALPHTMSPPRKLRQHRRLLAIVEQLVERHLKGARDFLDRVQRGHRVPVLDARDIAPQQAGALFDVPLGQRLGFTERANTVTDNNGGITP